VNPDVVKLEALQLFDSFAAKAVDEIIKACVHAVENAEIKLIA